MAKSTEPVVVEIVEVSREAAHFKILGETPLIFNRMSEKAKRDLLFPKGKRKAVEKATTLKHDPLTEYRASPYIDRDSAAPTLLVLPATAFKGAMKSAALDSSGTTKAQIGRLAYVHGQNVAIYGVPQLLMSVVRSADMAKTPDIRTRAIVPRWACEITVGYVRPQLRRQLVANLLAAAGLYIGVGDWRQEKGSGSHGLFKIVTDDDAEWAVIAAEGGRAAQQQAISAPECYDADTAELYAWYMDEFDARQRKGVA